VKEWICYILGFLLIIWAALTLATPVNAQEKQPELRLIDSTAYYDSYGHGHGATGRKLIEGVTVAYRPEDLGKTAVIYDTNMRLIGIYEITDTGYGQSTGKGKSKILSGRTIGTIENGQCIDIYFRTKAACQRWGRRKVYVQIIEAKG